MAATHEAQSADGGVGVELRLRMPSRRATPATLRCADLHGVLLSFLSGRREGTAVGAPSLPVVSSVLRPIYANSIVADEPEQAPAMERRAPVVPERPVRIEKPDGIRLPRFAGVVLRIVLLPVVRAVV